MNVDGWTDLRTRIDAIASAWSVPCGVAVITNRHGDLFTHSFGFVDAGRTIHVDDGHRFDVDPIDTPFTALVLMHCVREGSVRRDQAVGEILEWVPASLAEVRIDHLLQHTAGLVESAAAVPDPLAQVAGFTGSLSDAAPGSWYHRSALGPALAALVVEQLTGRRLRDLISELVFDPLGISDTASHTGRIAVTAGDLAGFARVLLARGVGLPDSSVVEDMITSLAASGDRAIALGGLERVSESRFGLGIDVQRVQRRTVLTFTLRGAGCSSFVLSDLARGVGVVVVTGEARVTPLAEVIARMIAGDAISHSIVPALDAELWAEVGDDPRVRPRPVAARMFGAFLATLEHGEHDELLVVPGKPERGLTRVEVEKGGERHELLWSWGDAVSTRHPELQGFPLHFDGEDWTWRDRVYRRTPRAPIAATGSPFVGHYRTYSPWFPNFRVVEREGELLMISAPAVESPGDEVELVAVTPGVFRIGADPRRPERLTFGPIINGFAVWVDRDGCRYSRSFLD